MCLRGKGSIFNKIGTRIEMKFKIFVSSKPKITCITLNSWIWKFCLFESHILNFWKFSTRLPLVSAGFWKTMAILFWVKNDAYLQILSRVGVDVSDFRLKVSQNLRLAVNKQFWKAFCPRSSTLGPTRLTFFACVILTKPLRPITMLHSLCNTMKTFLNGFVSYGLKFRYYRFCHL